MPEHFLGINRLRHTTQNLLGKYEIIVLLMECIHNLTERPRREGFTRNMISVVIQKLYKIVGFFFARFLMDSVEKWYFFETKEFGNLLVCENHKFFDNFMRFGSVPFGYVHHFPSRIGCNLHFLEVEINLSFSCTTLVENTLEFKPISNKRDNFCWIFFENFLSCFLFV